VSRAGCHGQNAYGAGKTTTAAPRRRRDHQPCRAGRQAQDPDGPAVRRAAPAARRGPGPGGRPGSAVPGRADHRVPPSRPAAGVAPGGKPQTAGQDGVLDYHFMDEAEALADRVAIIAAGAIVAEGAPQVLGGCQDATAGIRFRRPAGMDPAALLGAGARAEVGTSPLMAVLDRHPGRLARADGGLGVAACVAETPWTGRAARDGGRRRGFLGRANAGLRGLAGPWTTVVCLITQRSRVQIPPPLPASFRRSWPLPSEEGAFCVPGAVVRHVVATGLRAAWRRDGGDGVTRDETAWMWWTLPPATSGCLAQRYVSASRSLPVRAGLPRTCGTAG
jgi:hypothetical protein